MHVTDKGRAQKSTYNRLLTHLALTLFLSLEKTTVTLPPPQQLLTTADLSISIFCPFQNAV